ncbi:multicopper oxidase domain-containing protein [Halobacterium salinarum]|uniref:Membrane protein n=3 Tax=Halobacterium salinarum TaxID=2242 RepID=Q9HQF4_HALSA|nr:multicopper oxidase family protein [Halobacterium salinarum]AAG19561.1 membrane protein [Halobacterium salinarum NRC-1]MBB6090248.1 FtsP/CotA-like multicopper oxidase with cupredoxin domain [Halobacterium salinarum]MDL0119030.1 multicopper oxidase family protein [Halobacterium salinarum]MDL0129794.1 multicopper oxidase family protein [Halobacterium salinarum]MDL0133388.1 multicopper oxidase family protein [Halobacterium salinarum]
MTDQIGAPGLGISRRDFVAATAGVGTAAIAGCTAPDGGESVTDTTTAAKQSGLPTTSPPEVVDATEQGNQVTLKSVPAVHDVHPLDSMGGPVKLPRVWAFATEDGDPSVPGPIVRTEEGQDIEVTLDNTDGKRPHTLHFHGSQTAWEDDGVPTTTGIRVGPGEKHTYTIPANVPGTHLYHCHYQTQRHIDMGMYGIFRIDPKGYEPADKEYFMTVKDWDSRLNRSMAGEDVDYSPRTRNPDVFTVNGKSAPRTLHPEDGSPIIVEQGDTVRLHLVNGGYMNHPLHIHNHRFRMVEKDGGQIPAAAQHTMDITDMAPAERHTIEFQADADPGIYLMHCHKVNHVMNGTFYPGGMLSGIVYKDAMDSDIFGKLMDFAGYDA